MRNETETSATSRGGPSLRAGSSRPRLVLAAAVLTAALLALIARLFCIQILDHEAHAAFGRSVRRSSEAILSYRGDIHLADGVLLARDVVTYEVGIVPRQLPAERLPWVVKSICDAAGKATEYRRDRLQRALDGQARGAAYVLLVKGMAEHQLEEARAALERGLEPEELSRGLVATSQMSRLYPRETLASNVVGVRDVGGTGAEGIERSLDALLSSKDGRRELLKDARQKTKIFKFGSVEVPPSEGYDVYLTIDSRVQAIAEEELEAGIRRKGAEGGSLVVMSCKTGDVLAMASYPSYDPNRYSEYPREERDRRRRNRVIESLHEPGSVMKAFVAAYCLEEGVVTPLRRMESMTPPNMKWDGGTVAFLGRRSISDVHAHPGMTFEEALVHSSNVAFAILGIHLGKPGTLAVLSRFGLDGPTGIDLPAEAYWRPWADARHPWNAGSSPVSAAFGYEVMVTPLQLCAAFGAVINGGHLLKPRLVERVSRGAEERLYPQRVVVGRPISEGTSRIMRDLLRRVVEEGTAKWVKLEGFPYGAKTGTADIADGGYKKQNYLASFEAFAPFDDPEVVVVCQVEKPRRGSYYGGVVAGPIVARVFKRMYDVPSLTPLEVIEERERAQGAQ